MVVINKKKTKKTFDIVLALNKNVMCIKGNQVRDCEDNKRWLPFVEPSRCNPLHMF